MNKTTLRISTVAQGRQLLASIWSEMVKPFVQAGNEVWVTFQPETRTLPQNSKFHAICSDLSKSQMQWAGKRRTLAQWKVLLVSGHAAATKEEFEIVPGIEGEFVNIRESTALMSVHRGTSLIEYSLAFCVMNEVPLHDYNRLGLADIGAKLP